MFRKTITNVLVMGIALFMTIACASSAQRGEPVPVPVLGSPNLLQQTLNSLPAISIAGNNLQFEFGGDVWLARMNGENFSTGIIAFQNTEEGVILTLRQTHIWPGTVGKTAGNVANKIPGGGQVGGVLNMAGSVAGLLGAVAASGADIILECKAGPPASISVLSNSEAVEKITVAQEAGFESSGEDISLDNSSASVASDSRQKPSQKQPTRTAANAKDNWVSAELGIMGAGVNYERMLSSKLSLGANVYWYPMIFSSLESSFVEESSFLLNATFRFYPGGEVFFIGTGLGFCFRDYDEFADNIEIIRRTGSLGYLLENNFGLAITPETGGKVNLDNGLYVQSGLRGAIIFAGEGVILSGITYFGMGCAF